LYSVCPICQISPTLHIKLDEIVEPKQSYNDIAGVKYVVWRICRIIPFIHEIFTKYSRNIMLNINPIHIYYFCRYIIQINNNNNQQL